MSFRRIAVVCELKWQKLGIILENKVLMLAKHASNKSYSLIAKTLNKNLFLDRYVKMIFYIKTQISLIKVSVYSMSIHKIQPFP